MRGGDLDWLITTAAYAGHEKRRITINPMDDCNTPYEGGKSTSLLTSHLGQTE